MIFADRARDIGLGLTGILVVFFVWELFASLGYVSENILPPPSVALVGVFQNMPLSEVADHVRASLQRIVLGFAAGAGLGVVIGVSAAWYRPVQIIARPLIELLRPIPPLAWIPLAIIWFGLGEPSKVFVISIGAFFPMVTNAYKGVTTIDPMLPRAAQTMGYTGWRLLFRVAVPASLPDLATGIRVGWGLSFGVLVAAELIAADSGMGFMIMHARLLGNVDVIVFGIILIGVINLATDYALAALIKKKIGKWHPV